MNCDAVLVGSIITIVGCLGVLGYIAYRILREINRNSRH